jgi:type I restriction enzyme S subunit
MYGGYNQIGRTGILEIPAAVNQALTAIRPDSKRLHGGYLLRVLNYRVDYWRSVASSSRKDPNITSKDVREFPLALPLLPEQQSIAEALTDADALIEALEQLLAKKRQIKQGAMQELLTGQKRLPRFAGEWAVKSMGELFEFSGGFTASRDQLGEDGYCYLHYGDIHGSSKTYIDVRTEFYKIPKLDIHLKRIGRSSLLDDGDVVFVDASEDDEGTSKHVVIVNSEGVPFIAGLHTIVAKSKTDELDNCYKRYCFQTAAVKAQFRYFAVGTKVAGISKTNIAKINLAVPPLDEQTAIATVLADMDAEIAAVEARLAKARRVKQGMMQELLTGRIRLMPPKAEVIPFPATASPAPDRTKPRNRPFEEAVMLGVFAKAFGSETHPLARVRRTKLLYLLHRHVEGSAAGYLKKAAGPYDPKTRYQGPEGIAQRNGYVRAHHNGTWEGFIAGEKIAEAEAYFDKWYSPDVRAWLEQFHYVKTEELELLATVDMAMEDLRRKGEGAALEAIKRIIRTDPEWEAKLDRPIFSDANIERAMAKCQVLFGG